VQLDLTADQLLLSKTTARFIESELPLSDTRRLHDDPAGYERAWLRRAADIGWFAMLVPEADGGGNVSGQGILDAAILSEEIGRQGQPGPFLPMNVVAYALAALGSDSQRRAWLPGLVSGERVVTWAFADERGRWDGGAGMVLDAGRLSGRRGFVQEAPSADALLVMVGPALQALVPADAPGVRVEPLVGLDLGRRAAHVVFDGVEVTDLLAGDPLPQLMIGAVLTSADTVGALDTLLTMTVEYAKQRTAFGRPIGSFQAVKHNLADQAMYLETCRAGAVTAARALQAGDPNADEVVSMAAAYIGDVGNAIAQQCLQVHGGIGYTWEHDLHLLLRRVRGNASLFGDPRWHRQRVWEMR
jgi:alkylation response protein AidB-like acyl-CoA dehydrogenase